MQQKRFDEYINEMMLMYRSAKKDPDSETGEEVIPASAKPLQPPVIEQNPAPILPKPENKPDMSGSGKLIVKVTTARGMLPVADADVEIRQTDKNGGMEIAELETDASGSTPAISLPAPPKYKSESPQQPNDSDEVMAKYDITVSADGYVDAVIKGAAVFDGVTSIQNVDMLTESAANDD